MPSCLQFPKVTIPQQYIPFSNPTIYQENLDYATEMLEIKYVGNTMMAYGLARISCLLLLFIGVCIMIFVPNLEDYPDLFLTCMISTRILLTMFLLLSANIAYTHNVNIKAALLQLEETAESWSHSGVEYCIVRKSFCGYITGAEMVITWGR